MKKTILSMLSLLLFNGLAFAGGHSVGNGGDSQVIEFQNLGIEIFKKWIELSAECDVRLSINPQQLYKKILSTTVESTDEMLYLEENGNKVLKEAINYPSENRIIFNRAAFGRNWDSYGYQGKKQFVLHEYLGVLGIVDPMYANSNAILALIETRGCFMYGRLESRQSARRKGTLYPSVAIDEKGVIYIVDSAENKISRFSVVAQAFLPAIQPKFPVVKLAYSKRLKKLFLISKPNVLSYFNANDLTNEKIIVRTESQIEDFVVADDYIVLTVNGKYYSYFTW